MAQTYDKLLEKLDAFTRKYYQNQMIRGAIYFLALALGVLIFISLLEYFGQFSSSVRRVMFYSLVLANGILFVRYILYPALKLFRLGRQISHEEASKIIGKHFPEVSDKLLNTLQLKRQADDRGEESGLLMASIAQRIDQLEPVPFSAAINFGENRKYLKYVLPPIGLILIILALSPAMLTESTQRLVSYNTEFIPQAPFEFRILNESLETALNSNFTLTVEARGDYAPGEMRIDIDGKFFRLKREKPGTFSYTFRNVREVIPFQLAADGYFSEKKELKVLPTPSIIDFQTRLSYPKYLGKADEVLENSGNLKIPEGTEIQWAFKAQNTELLHLIFADTSIALEPSGKARFQYSKRAAKAERYQLSPSNRILGARDTLSYRIDVIKDAYPKIRVEAEADSSNERRIYFSGSISDDYGLRGLYFHYVIEREKGEIEEGKERLAIGPSNAQEFFHFTNFDQLDLKSGDRVTYYFEVWDNDGVNGSKATRSEKKSYQAPSRRELSEQRKESSRDIQAQLEESIKDARELQKEIDELNKDLMQNKSMGWQEKKRLEDLLKKQKNLQQKVEQAAQENKNRQQEKERYLEQSESILEKQRQLEKLFDELMSDELKEMFRKLEEMMEKLDQNDIREELENMKLSQEELEKNMDRSLELFKQMEFEMEFEQQMQALEELALEQEKLSEESAEKDSDSDALKEKQDELNERFEELKKDLEELKEKNEALERPNNLIDTEEDQDAISQDMQDSSDQLEKNKQKKASDSQKNAAQKMKDMQQKMQSAMDAGGAESAMEDMDALRALLENIIQLSFDQEDIMEELRQVNRDDPRYTELGREQKKLQDGAKMVEDSLYALSKRVVQIEAIVNEELGIIKRKIRKSLEEIGERQTANATNSQQYAMTSFNNLALLLDEALQQMQEAMASQMPGTGNCENPGGAGAKPSSGKMSKMQEEMGKRLEEMQKALEKGPQDGGSKPGMGNQSMSKEIAKMAAEQAALRKEIEKMAQELNQRGKGEGKGLEDIASQMEKQERDLVNMEISQETFLRQQDILTRLLESEKAEREREYEEERQSESPGEYERSNPEKYLEYKKRKAREIEFLRTVPPDMKPYYKERVNEYFLNFGDLQ